MRARLRGSTSSRRGRRGRRELRARRARAMDGRRGALRLGRAARRGGVATRGLDDRSLHVSRHRALGLGLSFTPLLGRFEHGSRGTKAAEPDAIVTRTKCSPFSMPQCPRTSARMASALAALAGRLVTTRTDQDALERARPGRRRRSRTWRRRHGQRGPRRPGRLGRGAALDADHAGAARGRELRAGAGLRGGDLSGLPLARATSKLVGVGRAR